MSDIELPDFGHHQNIDLDKGIFIQKKKGLLDSQSNDSGNHSMSTNASCKQELIIINYKN